MISRSPARYSGALPRPLAAVGNRDAFGRVVLNGLLETEGAWHALEVSACWPEHVRRVELHCEQGVAALGTSYDEFVSVFRAPGGPVEERIPAPGELPLLAELRAFVEHLRGGPPPRSSAAEGATVVAAITRLQGAGRVSVTDATILIPTHRHAAVLPLALRSALGQHGVSIEVFVVGDGVEDDTRAALEPFLADSRVRFFDFPKGERHGERHRHVALQEAAGEIICYLSDDDLLLPGHLVEMRRLLEHADFAHGAPVGSSPGVWILRARVRARRSRTSRVPLVPAEGRNNFIGLTGAATHARCTSGSPWLAAGAAKAEDRRAHVAADLRAAWISGRDGTAAHSAPLPRPTMASRRSGASVGELEAWFAACAAARCRGGAGGAARARRVACGSGLQAALDRAEGGVAEGHRATGDPAGRDGAGRRGGRCGSGSCELCVHGYVEFVERPERGSR